MNIVGRIDPRDVRLSEKTAYFGYKKVPEDEKSQWVLRHFNTVAKRYDFMNTLLSFGIHHLWKRTAIRLMGLNPGDRVLDVCGGTRRSGDSGCRTCRPVRPGGHIRHQPGHDRGRCAQGRSFAAKRTYPVCSRRCRNTYLFRTDISMRPWWVSAFAMSPIWIRGLKRCAAY